MNMSLATKQVLPKLLPVLLEMPENQHCDISWDGNLEMQCNTQAAVKAVRALFPGALWFKSYKEEGCNWWEYASAWQGIPIRIYACYEAPPTCRLIEEEVEVEEQVPTAWETKRVVKKVAKWDCGEEATS